MSASAMLEVLRGKGNVYEVREPGENHINVYSVEGGEIQAKPFKVPVHGNDDDELYFFSLDHCTCNPNRFGNSIDSKGD